MNSISVNKPFFTHDCETCIFLGTYFGPVFKNGDEEDWYDLYYHYNEYESTVIARYGNEGDQYQSGMNFARPDGIQPLYEARLMAIKAKLIEA